MFVTDWRGAPLVILALAASACNNDIDPLDSHGTTAPNPVTNQTGSGMTNPTDGGSGATDSGGTGGATDSAGTTTDTGGPAPTMEACEHYLACLAVTKPAELPAAQTGFGPDGTCWDGPPESIQQCIQACQIAWEELHDSYPDEPACYLCTTDADCTTDQTCVDGTCRPPCGNGIVADDEICDGAVGCDENCMASWGCNPLSGFGCEAPEVCLAPPQQPATCYPSDMEWPGLYEPCGLSCAAGLACTLAEGVPECGNADFCCTQLCHLQHENSCPDGWTCIPYLLDTPQANYVGACIGP